jgi:formylglycine-generating enzyme required for sulfatase activity
MATGYRPSAFQNKEEKLFNEVNGKGPKYPAGFISWKDATAFCRWKGKRLPTPQEWQLAALGTDGRRWPWGAADPKAGNINTHSVAEVGSHSRDRSPYGIFDMGGNMLEWTTAGTMGGSYATDWHNPTPLLNNLDDWVANTGFRCAADAK